MDERKNKFGAAGNGFALNCGDQLDTKMCVGIFREWYHGERFGNH